MLRILVAKISVTDFETSAGLNSNLGGYLRSIFEQPASTTDAYVFFTMFCRAVFPRALIKLDYIS